MALEFVAPDVEASSTLNSQQMNDFFNEMKKTVWKIKVTSIPPIYRDKEDAEEFYTGVCVRADGFILTSFFNIENMLKIYVQGPNEKKYFEAELVHRDRAVGLALVRANHLKNYSHIAFTLETNFDAGQHVYAIVYPRLASSSIFLMGHLAYQCKPDSKSTSENCPIVRRVGESPAEGVYPSGLGEDVSLLQIASLGASNESKGRMNYRWLNQFGFQEGRGGPVFDASGHLIGLVSFQQAGFDFAILVNVLKSFVSRYFDSHGQSKQHGHKGKKGKGPSSS